MYVGATTETSVCKAGDIIEFGEYPQSEVTDETLLTDLNAQTLEWISYGYYSGNGSFGSASSSDYMKYADVELGGEKYRAVTFSNYRPWQSEHDFENSIYIQQTNGYKTETVYWFKFEPIKWKVLNPDTGLVLCESIIDSQPFQNEVYHNTSEFFLTAHYADPEFTIPANTYSSSYLKAWLEGDFSETAFSQSETEFISQKAHLISVAESVESDYGFDSDKHTQDTERMRTGSDYAKVQGLQINEIEPGSGNSYWWLGDSVSIYQLESAVCYSGSSNRAIGVSCTYIGVCPAVTLNLSEIEYNIVLNKYDGSTQTVKYKYGESITEIPDPEKEGYTFTGWDAEIPDTMPAKNLEFNANWSVNQYSVTFKNFDSSVISDKKVDYGSKIEAPSPVRKGYVFTGWTPSIPETMPAEDIEFVANYMKLDVEKIEIIELPDKTDFFYKGSEDFNLSGISVKVTYKDGTTEVINDYTKLSFEGFRTNKLGEIEITVIYGDATDSFNVNVEFDLCTWLEYIVRAIFEFLNMILAFIANMFAC